MSERVPQPTSVLVQRLRRVAKWQEAEACVFEHGDLMRAQCAARANTCWQAAARLEELEERCQLVDALPSVDEMRRMLRKLEE